MKRIFLSALVACLCFSAKAQFLYGTSLDVNSPRSFIKFDPNTDSFFTLIPNFRVNQPKSTKDTATGIIYFMESYSLPKFDSLIAVNVRTNTVTKDALPNGMFRFPQYTDNGNIISICDSGLAEYNAYSKVTRIIDYALHLSNIRYTAYDHSFNRYLLLKNGQGSVNGVDTLYVYDLHSKAMTVHFLPTNGTAIELQYSPKDNQVVFDALQISSGHQGIFTYDLSSKTLKFMVSSGVSSPTFVDCSTFDEVGNRYFIVRATDNTFKKVSIDEYNLNTGNYRQHINTIGLGFSQYFEAAHKPSEVKNNTTATTQFSIYPNPASSRIQWQLGTETSTVTVSLFSNDGRLVSQKNFTIVQGNGVLDLQSVPSGSYLIRIQVGTTEYSRIFEKR